MNQAARTLALGAAGLLLHHEPLREAPDTDARGRLARVVDVRRRRVQARRGDAGHALQLERQPGLLDLVEVARLPPGFEPANDCGVPRQVDQCARAVRGDDLAAADLPVPLTAHRSPPTSPPLRSFRNRFTSGSTSRSERLRGISARARARFRVEHLVQERLRLPQFVPLVLQGDADVVVLLVRLCATSRADPPPGSGRCAAFVPLCLIAIGCWPTRSRKSWSRRAFERRPGVGDPLHSLRRRELGPGMAGQAHERPGQAAVERARRERRHARRLDRAVERLVVVAEALVVRAVARPVDVEQRDDQARAARRRGRRGSWPGCTRRCVFGWPSTTIRPSRVMSRPTEIMLVASATSTRSLVVERQRQPPLGLGDLVGAARGEVSSTTS